MLPASNRSPQRSKLFSRFASSSTASNPSAIAASF
jgi:hypothetical protein